jgi:hypothetical protein
MHDKDTFADEADEADDLLTRSEAAKFLQGKFHTPVAPRTLTIWPIPYRKVGHWNLWRRSDLMDFAERRLTNAPRQIGGVSKSPAPRNPSVAPPAPTRSITRPRKNEIKARGHAHGAASSTA